MPNSIQYTDFLKQAKRGEAFLILAIKSDDWYVRRQAVFELGGFSTPSAIEALTSALESEEDARVISHASIALARSGVAAFVPLVALLNIKHANPNFENFIFTALYYTLGKMPVEAILTYLEHPDALVRGVTAEVLSSLKRDITLALPLLIKMQQDEAIGFKGRKLKDIATQAIRGSARLEPK